MNSLKYLVVVALIFFSCNSDDGPDEGVPVYNYDAARAKFEGTIDLDNLYNYANQPIPSYITKDNTGNNPITDKGATLGRVLFYDKELSTDRTVSCATCHKQEIAFTDDAVQSTGVNGETRRHSMRLVNNRFSEEVKFFWDERAPTLMAQTTMPIQDHAEMGFSGENGAPDLEDLIQRLSSLTYYQDLFTFVYGDATITEERMQRAMAQFVSSIQSFDSKYDEGRAQAQNDQQPFANFTPQENRGKQLFMMPPQFDPFGNRVFGGLGCVGCHRAPEFDIDPNSKNNGTIGNLPGGLDFTNTRAPSLRDVINPDGTPNSALMHTANFLGIQQVLTHYNQVNAVQGNTNLDPRLNPGGNGQRLHITNQEAEDVIVFFRTLTGSEVYTNPKWGNPFVE